MHRQQLETRHASYPRPVRPCHAEYTEESQIQRLELLEVDSIQGVLVCLE